MFYYIIENKILGYENELDASLYDYLKLSEEQSDFYELHKCSLQEVLNLALNPVYVPDIENVRQSKINEIKAMAGDILSRSDYKVIRHRDQLDGNFATTLTASEFSELLTYRQSIRTQSNVLELLAIESTTIEELNAITVNYEDQN